MSKAKEWLLVLIAMSASTWLQLLSLAKWNVWHDESFTAMMINYGWRQIVVRTARDVHPPLYYFVLKLWAAMFGNTEVALRSLSVVLTAVVLLLTYLLIKRLFGIRPALFSLITLVLAPFMVRYGQEARMYPLVAVFVALQAHAFLSLLRGDKRRSIKMLYVAASALAFYTHYYALLITFTEIIYLVSLQKKPAGLSWWSPRAVIARLRLVPPIWGRLWLGLLVGIAPWLPVAIRQAAEIQTAFWIRWVSQDSFYSTLTSFLFFKESYGLARYAATAGLLVVGCFVLLCVKVFRTEEKLKTPLMLLGGYFAGPVVLLFVSSLFARSTYYDRYFVSYAGAFYGFLGVALYFALAHRYWHAVVRAIVVLTLVGALVVGVYRVNTVGDYDGNRGQYSMRDVMRYVNTEGSQGDAVVASGLGVYFDARFYSANPYRTKIYMSVTPDGWGNTTLIVNRPDLLIEDLSTSVMAGRYVWFISGQHQPADIPPNWQPTAKTITLGYASATRYFVSYDPLAY